MRAAMTARFEQAGLEYTPHPDVVPNTMDALRLTELAREVGVHGVFHNRLMAAYWSEGANLSEHDELRRLAHDLPPDDVERVLATDAYRERVHASTAQAQAIGVTGVPGFLLDGRLLVLGAQPRAVFEQAFAQLESDR